MVVRVVTYLAEEQAARAATTAAAAATWHAGQADAALRMSTMRAERRQRLQRLIVRFDIGKTVVQ